MRRKHTKTPGYSSWVNMKARCSNPDASKFKHYGGRGISVCERWRSFGNFIADMGPKPSTEHRIDRIDNDGNYEPGNCRWATRKEETPQRRQTRAATKTTPKKRGRPRKDDPIRSTVAVALTASLLDQLDKWMAERGITSRSEAIRGFVERGLKRRGK